MASPVFDILEGDPARESYRLRLKKGRNIFQVHRHNLGLEFSLQGKRFYYLEDSSPTCRFWFQNLYAAKADQEREAARAAEFLGAGAPLDDPEKLENLESFFQLFDNEVYHLRRGAFRARLLRNPDAAGPWWERLLDPLGFGGKGSPDKAHHYLQGPTRYRGQEDAPTPCLLPIQNLKRLDREAVGRWREAIRGGRRPACFGYTIMIKKRVLPPQVNPLLIVTVLLDGHHKAAAYAELGEPIPVVCLIESPWSGDYIDDIFSLFPLT